MALSAMPIESTTSLRSATLNYASPVTTENCQRRLCRT
jgi:hypothetical protein